MSQAASRGLRTDIESENLQIPADAKNRLQKSDLDLIYQPITQELAAVELVIGNELHSDTPWVDRLLEHDWISGGKRIRPVFLLLSGACCGELGQSHLQMAAAVEMIHAATLVHDDVLDKAEIRRHQPTVNAKWGNRISVLLGDYLFTHAFHVASASLSAPAVKMLAESSNRICEGEMRQNASQGNFELAEQEYLSMISDKTAELCGCSCRLGAFLSAAPQLLVESFGNFGQNLGVAFQIIDDVLDLVGQQKKVGKTLGTDLLNQKPTLPIIHCLNNLPQPDRRQLLDLLPASTTRVDDVVPFLERAGSLQYARKVAQDHAHEAVRFATELAESRYSQALHRLAEFVLKRTY